MESSLIHLVKDCDASEGRDEKDKRSLRIDHPEKKLTKRIISVKANMTVEECQTLANIQCEALVSGADAVADMQW